MGGWETEFFHAFCCFSSFHSNIWMSSICGLEHFCRCATMCQKWICKRKFLHEQGLFFWSQGPRATQGLKRAVICDMESHGESFAHNFFQRNHFFKEAPFIDLWGQGVDDTGKYWLTSLLSLPLHNQDFLVLGSCLEDAEMLQCPGQPKAFLSHNQNNNFLRWTQIQVPLPQHNDRT